MADSIKAVWTGIGDLSTGIKKMTKAEDAATRKALVKVSAELRKRIRANTPVRKTALNRQPPPGDTKRGVHALRPKHKRTGEWTGKVSAMGGRRNLYVGRLEAKEPFVAPVEDAFDPLPIFEAEWDKAFKL